MTKEKVLEYDVFTCKQCGGNCGDECGTHPAGCIYGGFSYGYWMVDEECGRLHVDQCEGGISADRKLTDKEKEFYKVK